MDEWVTKVAVLDYGCRETRNAMGKMVAWSNGWAVGSGGTGGNGRQGGVAKLSEMSFKTVLPGVVRQVSAIDLEQNKLPRTQELELLAPFYHCLMPPGGCRFSAQVNKMHDTQIQ